MRMEDEEEGKMARRFGEGKRKEIKEVADAEGGELGDKLRKQS